MVRDIKVKQNAWMMDTQTQLGQQPRSLSTMFGLGPHKPP